MAEDTVKVSRGCVVCSEPGTETVLYRKGFEGTALSDHIEKIVASGAGERTSEQQPKKVAENQDAFRSGSNNVSIG